MKRISIITALLTFCNLLNAQLYMRSESGYMFSTHPLVNHSTVFTGNTLSVYTMSFKYGAGVPLVFSVGYDLNSLFSIELSAGAHVFSSYKMSTDETDLASLDNFVLNGFIGDIKYHSNIFQIAPQMVCHFSKNKFTLNMKAGPGFLKSRIIHKMNYTFWEFDNWEYFPLRIYEEDEYTTGLNIGVRASVGIDYNYSDYLSICMDLVSSYNRCKITRGEIKRYDIDGVDHIEDITTTMNQVDIENPEVNFSQTGIIVGIKIRPFHGRVK